MTNREREHREPSDVPGFGRVGGIDDPVPRAEYGDDPETVRERARNEVEGEAATRDDRRAELLELSNELRAEILSFYDGRMEAAGFVRRVRSLANELERHADAIEARDGDGDGPPRTGMNCSIWHKKKGENPP